MKQKTAWNLLSVLLALTMVVGLLPETFLTALAETASVSYVDAKGNNMGSVSCQRVA